VTQRERDVVRLVVDGMRNQEMALQLNLTEHTVRNYLIGSSTNWAYRAAWNWFSTLSAERRGIQPPRVRERIPLRPDESHVERMYLWPRYRIVRLRGCFWRKCQSQRDLAT